MDDDVWDDDDESYIFDTPTTYMQKDLEKLQETHSNEGYKAGITAGQSHSAQEGFDSGHLKGAQLGIQFGRILGSLMGLQKLDFNERLHGELEGLIKEARELSEELGKGGVAKDVIESFEKRSKVVVTKVWEELVEDGSSGDTISKVEEGDVE